MTLPDPIPVPPGFQGFDQRGALRIYDRNLPHWRQAGASYFVTFRLAVSIPLAIVAEMTAEAQVWRERVLREEKRHGGQLPEPVASEWHEFQRRHLQKLESLMDSGLGSCVLRDTPVRAIVSDALRFFDGERYDLHGFVVMPNHTHLCVQPRQGWELEDILRSWKGFTSRALNKRLGRSGTLWQQDNYNRIVRDTEHFTQVIRYIANNPIKARLRDGEFTVWFPFETAPNNNATERVERTSKSVPFNNAPRDSQTKPSVVREEPIPFGGSTDDVW